MRLLYYTPTWEGFLTAVFEVFDRRRKGETLSIRRPCYADEVSMFPSERIEPDTAKAVRVERGMQRLGLPQLVYQAWLSELPDVEDNITALLTEAFAQNKNPLGNHSLPVVREVNKAIRQTGQERQRMLQFVRFVQTPEGIYAADIEPSCNVLPLIAEHFHGRFNDQRLLIRDIKRRLVLVSQREGWFINELPQGESEILLPPLPADGVFEELWRGYFHAVSNPARKNLKQQQQFVPLRYRKHLTEFQEIPRRE